jgi:RHS repeat-associated protein
LSRVRQRLVYEWQSGVGWNLINTTRYMYDGRLLWDERTDWDGLWSTYIHGQDLSGTFDGAGGIGAFLGRVFYDNETLYYHSDALGNVTALQDVWQNVTGRHKYDPFGNEISTTGYHGDINPIRFSSKVFHTAAGIYDYGFRFYDPGLERWLNRDPLGESGGLNLYRVVKNNFPNAVDAWGLEAIVYNFSFRGNTDTPQNRKKIEKT